MFKELKTAILTFLILTVITGILYPLFITGVSQVFFHSKADGSLIYRNGKPVGSSFIGQSFDDSKYFWPRPSATSPVAFNAASSSGSNLGPSNPTLAETIKNRVKAYKAADPNNTNPVPIDLVTSSASGLDPHISFAAVYYQVPRIARIRGLPEKLVKTIISTHSRGRLLTVLGEPVVNVLELNLALDTYKK